MEWYKWGNQIDQSSMGRQKIVVKKDIQEHNAELC